MTRLPPSSDPDVQRERRRARGRAAYARKRDEMVDRQREWRARNPERSREVNNASRARNVERAREYNRDWQERNQDRLREYRRANRSRDRASDVRRRHGPWIAEDRAAMWLAQDGKCYLCGDELDEARAHMDHDHRCCPDDRSCRSCRRGLACNGCNVAVGMAGDDPDRLRRMADNLEMARAAAEERIAYQPELLSTGSTG